MRSLQAIRDGIYNRIGVASSNAGTRLTPAILVECVNRAWREEAGKIRDRAPQLALTQATASLVKDVAYTLPDRCIQLYSMDDPEQGGSYGSPLASVNWAGAGIQRSWRGVERQGRTFVLRGAESATFQFRYLVEWADLHYGTIYQAGADGTEAYFARSGSVGDVQADDDVYNGLILVIYAGTGSGQLRLIDDYTGSTKLAKVATAFSPVLDNTSQYCVLPPWPAALDESLEYGAISRLGIEELAAKAYSAGGLQMASASVERWLAQIKNEGGDFSRQLEQAIAEERTFTVGDDGGYRAGYA